MRFFNTTGPVRSRDHYRIPPLERFELYAARRLRFGACKGIVRLDTRDAFLSTVPARPSASRSPLLGNSFIITSSVSCPNNGAGVRTPLGAWLRRQGIPVCIRTPTSGCGSRAKKPRSLRCGSSARSLLFIDGKATIPAACNNASSMALAN